MSFCLSTLAWLDTVSNPDNNAKAVSLAYCHMSVCLWRQLSFYQNNPGLTVRYCKYKEQYMKPLTVYLVCIKGK